MFFFSVFDAWSYFQFWNHIVFNMYRSMHHFCFYKLFFAIHWPTAQGFDFCSYHAFLQSSKILHIHFINKIVPAKRDGMFILEKNVPPKRDSDFMKVGSLLGGRTYFNTTGFLFFNIILLKGETSFNQGPQFSRMFFFIQVPLWN